MLKTRLAAFLLLLVLITLHGFAGAAEQGEHWVTSGFVSHHAKGDYNENNRGIGYEYRKGKFGDSAGYYLNSLSRDSVYAGVSYRLYDNGTVAAGVMGGIVTGYNYPIVPLALPFLQLTAGSFAVMVTASPPIPNVTPFVVAAQFKWRF